MTDQRREGVRWTAAVPLVVGLCVLVVLVLVLGTATRDRAPGVPDERGPGTAGDGGGPRTGRGAAAHAAGGRVAAEGWVARPLPAGWTGVAEPLQHAVDAARAHGFELTMCVRALDTAGEEQTCAGTDQPIFAASVPKIAIAVAALEAVGGDPLAPTPYDATVGDLVDAAITVSDNEAAGLLVHVAGQAEPDADPFGLVNAVTARVGLDRTFHAGNYFTEDEESTGEGAVTASGCVGYLAELVRAADGRPRTTGRPLTDGPVARIVLGAMHRQERTSKIPRLLPPGTTANKTGETDEVSHDVAVLNTASGRFALSATGTASDENGNADDEVARAALEVADLLGGAVPF